MLSRPRGNLGEGPVWDQSVEEADGEGMRYRVRGTDYVLSCGIVGLGAEGLLMRRARAGLECGERGQRGGGAHSWGNKGLRLELWG